MTKKRFKKLLYSWIIKNRNSFEDLGKALKSVRKVGFHSGTMKPNDHTYQRAWNFLSVPVAEEIVSLEE